MTSATQSVVLTPSALAGDLVVPLHAKALVLFAHGSGSSRLSSRNRWVAQMLQRRGMATLLFDLLTPDEALDRRNVFDIPLLGERVKQAIRWCRQRPDLEALALCLFGASTGAAAALVAAAESPHEIAAVVLRGGRPDLSPDHLYRVVAPTLMIVGGQDPDVLRLNQWALDRLHGIKRLEVVAQATHLFEEPGALERVAELAGDWFLAHIPAPQRG